MAEDPPTQGRTDALQSIRSWSSAWSPTSKDKVTPRTGSSTLAVMSGTFGTCRPELFLGCCLISILTDTIKRSTFTPLIFSGILYAANTDFHVSYVDCLYNCVSAMTVCGLTTVDLSGLTGFQQALLFIQMCMGSPVSVTMNLEWHRSYSS